MALNSHNVKKDRILVDLVEDKTRNRMVFVLAALLSYIYLTWTLYISSTTTTSSNGKL